MEYSLHSQADYPLLVYRVYPKGPAGRAGVPRGGTIMEVNGVKVAGERAYSVYDSVLSCNKEISLKVFHKGDTLNFEMEKEDVYAPTVYVDTIAGTIVVSITNFKLKTADVINGSYGELKAYLDSTRNYDKPRILDLRGNPGGHVDQCIPMADLFIESGVIITESWRTFNAYGNSVYRSNSVKAESGDPGEGKKFLVLVNRGSASCAEIFTAAIQEGAHIPVVGENTYGKGIGQTTWKTMEGGLAIITNIEFLTPNGNSYHKDGIAPDYPCESATIQCGLEALQKIYGGTSLQKTGTAAVDPIVIRKDFSLGGAFVEGEML